MHEVQSVASEFGTVMKEVKKKVAIAESCTGGALSHLITNIPGSSEYFLGGVVVYSDESKVKLLDVSPENLKKHGAVSEEVVKEMAASVRKIFSADYGIAISGIAGPSGGSPEKPMGTVFIGIADGDKIEVEKHLFSGDRLAIKRESCLVAMELLIKRD